MKIKFGGVPIYVNQIKHTIVAIPPMLHECAMPRNNPTLNGRAFAGPTKDSSLSTTAIAFGTMINAAAVLEIHILIFHAVNIKPKTTRAKFFPVKISTFKAIRLCKFHLSIASATVNPPVKIMEMLLMYAAETLFPS